MSNEKHIQSYERLLRVIEIDMTSWAAMIVDKMNHITLLEHKVPVNDVLVLIERDALRHLESEFDNSCTSYSKINERIKLLKGEI